MARMLGATRPNYRRTCRYARKGCTCYLYPYTTGSKAKVLRRRAQQQAEKRRLRTS
ncbi:hypothetical protein [Streptomyces chiangmaiensis]|uniref:Uncharacterized protein n=1 Tax=Streptomyces chiangmaiensis TaxID=766497 RepID=A0ABU7FNG3_9ACTN|nr:hypothetical protein [Streptomyces chiangmaiensis]MED7825505.1 hypothetical protein [Streptomyces chiangmaiensis]